MLLCVALALAACSKPEPQPEPIRAVKLVTVAPDRLERKFEFAAEVRPRVESRLGFRVGGKITRRQAELGQSVKAGQLLAQIDPQDLQLAANAARAQVAAAQTNHDLAEADFKRYAELKAQNYISGAELERRESTLKAAKAQLDQAKAQLSAQGNQAGYAELRADAPGIITGIEAEPGQVVAAGTPVVRIARDSGRDAVFSVPEDRIRSIKNGDEVGIRVYSSGAELRGKVREVAASADPVTRTFSIKVALPEDKAPPLGSTVYVTPDRAEQLVDSPVIKLPTTALRREGAGSAVWVLDPKTMTVRSQPVQVATADGNEAVISSGLSPGARVVVAGVHVLSPGQKVKIYEPRYASPPASESFEATKNVAKTPAASAAPVPSASSTPPAGDAPSGISGAAAQPK